MDMAEGVVDPWYTAGGLDLFSGKLLNAHGIDKQQGFFAISSYQECRLRSASRLAQTATAGNPANVVGSNLESLFRARTGFVEATFLCYDFHLYDEWMVTPVDAVQSQPWMSHRAFWSRATSTDDERRRDRCR